MKEVNGRIHDRDQSQLDEVFPSGARNDFQRGKLWGFAEQSRNCPDTFLIWRLSNTCQDTIKQFDKLDPSISFQGIQLPATRMVSLHGQDLLHSTFCLVPVKMKPESSATYVPSLLAWHDPQMTPRLRIYQSKLRADRLQCVLPT